MRQNHNRFGQATGAPQILPLGYKYIQMQMESGVDIVPLLDHWRDEQLMAFGVPRSVLGQVVSGDRSAAETNQYVFDRHAILPIANLIADALTLQLASDFDPKLFVEFEEFVSADKAFELEQEKVDLIGKVRSINQVRQDRGLDEVPWGEDPVGTIADQPYDPSAIDFFEPDVPTAFADDEPDEGEEPRTRTRKYWTAASEEKRQAQREKKYTPAFRKAVGSIFRDQLNSVLGRVAEAEAEEVPRARVIDPNLLFDADEWQRVFELRTEPLRQAAFQEILAASLVGFEMEDLFVFTESMQKMLHEQGALMIRQVNATTGKRLAQAISKHQAEIIAAELAAGVGAGEGVGSLAKRIREVFKVRGHEAQTIARTEILKASQTAQLESFEIADVEKKQWGTQRDPAVRDSHSYAAGQIRDRGEAFDLAGEAAMAPGVGPGGTSLSAGNSINCRCFVLPVEG